MEIYGTITTVTYISELIINNIYTVCNITPFFPDKIELNISWCNLRKCRQ